MPYHSMITYTYDTYINKILILQQKQENMLNIIQLSLISAKKTHDKEKIINSAHVFEFAL